MNTAALRVTDKMPGNFFHLGLIQLMLPNARVIHCKRDPLDTCLSCYFQDFNLPHGYANELHDIAEFYLGYHRLISHWEKVLDLQMLPVRYEELVADPERVIRRIVDFSGIEWDEQCLQYYENSRYVGTASYQQVRQPIYTGSVQRWRNYQRYLEPLIRRLGPLLES
jgi:hypothetical protein